VTFGTWTILPWQSPKAPGFGKQSSMGLTRASKWEGLHEQDSKRLGSSFTQEVRVAVVEAVKGKH
jgi:hypothetical protein